MKPVEKSEPVPSISTSRLLSVALLAIGMLLASTMTLKASWLWVLAPVGLLLWLEGSSGVRGAWLAALPFYGGLAAVALAFNFVGLPESPKLTRATLASSGGCGSGGCGTAAGCGSGGCGASSGSACSCSSGATTRKSSSVTNRVTLPPSPPKGVRPSTVLPANRTAGVMPPGYATPVQGQPVRVSAPVIQAPPGPTFNPAAPPTPGASGATPTRTLQSPPPALKAPAAPSTAPASPPTNSQPASTAPVPPTPAK